MTSFSVELVYLHEDFDYDYKQLARLVETQIWIRFFSSTYILFSSDSVICPSPNMKFGSCKSTHVRLAQTSVTDDLGKVTVSGLQRHH